MCLIAVLVRTRLVGLQCYHPEEQVQVLTQLGTNPLCTLTPMIKSQLIAEGLNHFSQLSGFDVQSLSRMI